MRKAVFIFSIFFFLVDLIVVRAADVDVQANSGEEAVLSVQDNSSNDHRKAIYAHGNSTGGDVFGVYAEANGGYGTGVYAEANGEYGTGVYSIGGSAGGVGVLAFGDLYGVFAYGFEGDALYCYGNSYAVDHINYSDARIKKNIKDLTPALGKVMLLKPKTYELDPAFIKTKTPHEEHIGLVAQDVETIFPQLVKSISTPTFDDKKRPSFKSPIQYKGLNYEGLIPVLIKAMQEQEAKIDVMQAEITALKAGK